MTKIHKVVLLVTVVCTILAACGVQDKAEIVSAVDTVADSSSIESLNEVWKDFDIAYINNRTEIVLHKYKGDAEIVVIPNTVDNLPVIGLENTFNGNERVIKVTVPDSVTKIDDMCFYNCKNLQEVKLSDNISSIGYMSFAGCKSLKSINLPSSLRTIREMAFFASSLEELEIPEGVELIEDSAFSGIDSLKSITLPNSIKTLGKTCFDYDGYGDTDLIAKVYRGSVGDVYCTDWNYKIEYLD